MFRRERIEYKTGAQVAKMRAAGLVVAAVHDAVREATRAGVTTAELDAVAAATIAEHGAVSSFLGYHGYPATICVSVNEEIVHGIPGDRVIRSGDVVSIDAGAIVAGWHGDAAFTMVVDPQDPADLALSEATENAMWAGLVALATKQHLGAVGDAVEDVVDASPVPFGIVQDYVGHGIGRAMHQPPEVLNYRTRENGARIKPGLCVAVEPMLTRGSAATRVLEDDWTVVTQDGSRAAHWEHTVAIGPEGIWVLTSPDGGEAALAARGVTIAPWTE
ncbi:type I methionyl aminopeptidase [Actinotalea sp.]|uniref:type I methionyl aminopeptidase n=1 Tax=Actinotalea sp. TaxID=1872145 RepID=UPI00356A7E9B